MLKRASCILLVVLATTLSLQAQKKQGADTVQNLTLDQCVVYALEHHPAVMQSMLGVSIAQKTNAINLSAWLPQVNLIGNYLHYNMTPTTIAVNPVNPEGPYIQDHSAITNSVVPQLSATETIFSPDVLYAARNAHLLVQLAQESNDSTKINLVAYVSKSFYALLNTLEQVNVFKEDTARLAKNLRDTYNQYVGGIADKTDYKEAAISLNTSKAQLKQANESIRPQYAGLKQLMGYPVEKQFNVSFDTLQMAKQIKFDTTQQLQYEKRIEFQQIQTAKSIQKQTEQYQRSQYLPTVSAFYNYFYEYQSDAFSSLFPKAYPYAYVGATFDLPLFTGMRRQESIQRAKMQRQQIEWAETNLKSGISSEYITALGAYKSNLFDLTIMKENETMAKDVYTVVSLQYKQGVVAYLNVITAESNLISSEIGYLNALFQLLSSKVDLDKAMGNTSPKR